MLARVILYLLRWWCKKTNIHAGCSLAFVFCYLASYSWYKLDQKQKDPPPDVCFTQEAKGREGGPPEDRDKCMLGPRKYRAALNQVCRSALCLKWLMEMQMHNHIRLPATTKSRTHKMGPKWGKPQQDKQKEKASISLCVWVLYNIVRLPEMRKVCTAVNIKYN